MKKPVFRLLLAALFVFLPAMSVAQDTIKEPLTQKDFPRAATVTYDNQEYFLELTGLTVRKKFIVKVYAMAHYMLDAPTGRSNDVIREILTDNRPKQITMHFVRGVAAEKIQDAFRDGFRNNVSETQLQAMKPKIDKFCGFFGKDALENDLFILRWLPGGIISVVIRGQEQRIITDEFFAKALWSIWFGEKSIVDRSELIKEILVQ